VNGNFLSASSASALLEREIALLLEQLKSAARDRRTLEARLKDLLARRRALEQDAPGQQTLAFDEPAPLSTPPCANEAPDGETADDKIRPRHVRTNAPRKLAFEALPREHLRHELLAEERVCKLTGKPLVEVGEVTYEELDYRPAKLVVVVHHRVTYGLAEADRREFTIEPIVTPEPPRAIEDARVGAGLLAQILVQKYTHHLPLYRQQAIFERAGLKIPRQTMCDWVLAGAFNLAPIQYSIRSAIVKSNVVLLDDTPIKCQGGRGGTIFQTHLWTYSSPCADGVVFDFAADRGHVHVLDFLGPDFTGYLVGDGYAGYGTIASKRPGVIEAGCWAHALRKFRDARNEAPAEAASMMSAIARLFDIERDADSAGLDAQARHALRQERSKPALAYIESLAKVQRAAMSEGGDYSGALKYLTNQWKELSCFLEDGRVPIHNNASERAIRPIAVGRRNWLFAGSERGGQAAAIIYSLVESCRRVGVDPQIYLRDVLIRVATHPASRVHELTPANWTSLFAQHAGN
jgi:transposase